MVCARAASAARAIMSGSSEPSTTARTPARSSRRERRSACSIASVDSKVPKSTTGYSPSAARKRRSSATASPAWRATLASTEMAAKRSGSPARKSAR